MRARLGRLRDTMHAGFGISFYGFFVFAAAWCIGYFAWALWANRRHG
ncbi:MAG: hypothetical protein ACE5HV_12155 [Acidobacteriota bacterium]